MEEVSIGDGSFRFKGYPLSQLITAKDFKTKYKSGYICSAAWRGYKGYWSISGNSLYLDMLVKNPCSFEESEKLYDLKVLFPNYKTPYSSQKASWFTGEIVIPISENQLVEGEKNSKGYQLIEHEVIAYTIKNGDVIKRVIEKRER